MEITLTITELITTIAGIVTGLAAIFGAIFAVYRWYLRQKQQDVSIADLEAENTILCRGMLACLDGLIQLGANHIVPKIKNELEKHLNKKAHELDDFLEKK